LKFLGNIKYENYCGSNREKRDKKLQVAQY